MPFSTYLADKVVEDYIVNGASVGLVLHTANPTPTGAVGAVPALPRLNITSNTVSNDAGGASNIAQVLSEEFPVEATITHVSVWSNAVSGGQCLYYGPVTGTPRTVAIGDIWRLGPGALTITNLT